ncbi:hypothetical protein BKA70DRAFT_1557609 [Coprinopsis sp. MPI-PUGE-AT-0042]|nr:hypothetical protein BKA70DRAFT_1557609 [Coprinopsis sp. MPI-PUGE-AT-0042]
MEKYFPVVKRTATHENVRPIKKTPSITTIPEVKSQSVIDVDAEDNEHLPTPSEQKEIAKYARELSRSDLNEVLIATLSKATNPITHSDLRERSDKVHTASTGHQRAEERYSRREYLSIREPKLKLQRANSSKDMEAPQIFRNVRVYINGYLEATTDIEIKRIVAEGGGSVVPTPSRSTHILTSTGLSGSKSQKVLKGQSQKRYIVKPEWVLDSHEQGKRRSESMYTIKLDRIKKATLYC